MNGTMLKPCAGGCGLMVGDEYCQTCAWLEVEYDHSYEAARNLRLSRFVGLPRTDMGIVPMPDPDKLPLVDRFIVSGIVTAGIVFFALALIGLVHLVHLAHLDQGPW